MKTHLTSVLALLTLATLGCAGGSDDAEASSIPAPPSAKVGYFGTSPTDVWAFSAGSSSAPFSLQHWNGAAWSDVGARAGLERASSACVAGPGKAWIAGDLVLGTIDKDGTLSDLSAQAPVAPPSAFRSVQCGHGVALLSAGNNSGSNTDTAKLFLSDGGDFKEIPSPDGSGKVGAATLFAANDIYVPAPGERLMLPDAARDTAGPDYHFDGSSWLRGTANGSLVGVAGASANFPPDDVWASCGPNAVHFDGATLWPLTAPLPATNACRFGYRKGRPIMAFAAAGDPGETPEAYACDQNSNCQLLDVAGVGSLGYRRVEWDGKQWAGNRKVANVKACVGPGCGYNGGGPSSGLVGDLEDGTLLLQATDGSKNRVYLIE